ncbi:hypothetical protein EKO27_g8321 [Xylaria grammica]|uniref:Uncharacterized protein n=1 Tax=Xylaria grammica TaxID=363999 RepID=A0A439CXN8_9PEZI|nr:hypothetical protein EKO27_g8321 [Xylaria grammica]
MAIRGAVGNNSVLVNRYCKCIAAEQGDEKRCVDLTLLYAIETSKAAVTRCLLENGADPNGFNDENTPILHCAIRYGEESVGNFSYLQSSGFDLLLRYGADLDIQSKDSKQESALHVAVRWGKLGFIRFLLRYGMDPRSADSEGRPPLFAIFDRSFDYDNHNCLEIISHLVSRGADPNQQDNEGRRALHLAAQKGSRKVMELLIRLGAACDQPDATGKLPLDYARETNDHASIGLLESYISSHTLEH